MKFLIFIAAVIILGIITIRLKRKNKERTNALLSDLIKYNGRKRTKAGG